MEFDCIAVLTIIFDIIFCILFIVTVIMGFIIDKKGRCELYLVIIGFFWLTLHIFIMLPLDRWFFINAV